MLLREPGRGGFEQEKIVDARVADGFGIHFRGRLSRLAHGLTR